MVLGFACQGLFISGLSKIVSWLVLEFRIIATWISASKLEFMSPKMITFRVLGFRLQGPSVASETQKPRRSSKLASATVEKLLGKSIQARFEHSASCYASLELGFRV